ncbi:MAG: GntR family transcriptional regulator [Pseudomonadota bacterium]|nr:GntR family transcriptional regulator [Pseudomonadota bacterium]
MSATATRRKPAVNKLSVKAATKAVTKERAARLDAPEDSAVRVSDIVKLLREQIRLGRLVPRQRLVEADIVAETGASRSKVREALRRLESEGLVSIEEFRGASVRHLGMDEVRQIYKARMALEGMAAGDFARADNAKLKKQLQKLQSGMNALEKSGSHERFAQLNDAWHALIIEGSGNRYAAQFLSQLSVPVYRLLFTTFYNAQRIDRANADHKVITQAIVDGRADDAERAMRNHILDGFAALSEINARLHI